MTGAVQARSAATSSTSSSISTALSKGSLSAWLPVMNPAMASAGALMLLFLLAFLLLNTIDGRVINGVGVWIKPAKFAASLSLHLLTLGLLWTWLGDWQNRWPGWLLTRAVIASALFEIAYIAYRATRAEPSHYNFETPFSTLMFQLMGVGATLLVLIPAGAGIVAWRRGAMADPFGRSVTLALIMSGILGLVTGAFLSTHGGHFVGTPAQGAGAWPVFGWSTAVGDLRAAHFVGLHILQILPIAGWIIMRLCNADRAMFAVNATAVALAILTLSLAALAYAGLPVSL